VPTHRQRDRCLRQRVAGRRAAESARRDQNPRRSRHAPSTSDGQPRSTAIRAARTGRDASLAVPRSPNLQPPTVPPPHWIRSHINEAATPRGQLVDSFHQTFTATQPNARLRVAPDRIGACVCDWLRWRGTAVGVGASERYSFSGGSRVRGCGVRGVTGCASRTVVSVTGSNAPVSLPVSTAPVSSPLGSDTPDRSPPPSVGPSVPSGTSAPTLRVRLASGAYLMGPNRRCLLPAERRIARRDQCRAGQRRARPRWRARTVADTHLIGSRGAHP
jgi:hypothetical protein